MRRRHHNTTGERQIRRGKTRDQVKRIAERLDVPYGKPLSDDMAVGDVISINGPTVPVDLRDKWFRVEAMTFDGATLSMPYYDEELTSPYQPGLPPVTNRINRPDSEK
jgi:hypothetical protein